MSDPPTRVHVIRAHITSDPAPVRFVPGDVLEEAGGWLRCRTSSGHEGWVPGDIVEPA